MACRSPIAAQRLADGTISFNAPSGAGNTLSIPCGRCVLCRIKRAQDWTARCLHESTHWEHNSFVTLTYDDEHYPENGQLIYKDFQDFMKRLRIEISRQPGLFSQGKKHNIHCPTQEDADINRRLRYYMCGEYGDINGRPHFHALLFNIGFADQLLWSDRAGNRLYRSPVLERLWPFGFSTIGAVTEETIAYTARYVHKKMFGNLNFPFLDKETYDKKYRRVNIETGEVYYLNREFNKMSLKPAIGQEWIERYYADVYPADAVVMRGGRKQKPPRYYDLQFEKINPDMLDQLKAERELKAIRFAAENTPARLEARATVREQALNNLKGTL